MSQMEIVDKKQMDYSLPSNEKDEERRDRLRKEQTKKLAIICNAIEEINKKKLGGLDEKALREALCYLRRGHASNVFDSKIFDQALKNLKEKNYGSKKQLQDDEKSYLIDDLKEIVYIYKEMERLQNGDKAVSKIQQGINKAIQMAELGLNALNTALM